jgi:hypothetical protein
MLGSEFISTYGRKTYQAWEKAAIDLAREGSLTPWPWTEILVSDGENTARIPVQTDVVSIGTLEDHLRLPMTPMTAQSIANLTGSLLTTPLLEYRIWQQAGYKANPTGMVPNQGVNLEQFAAHSRLIDDQLRAATVIPGTLVAGIKKGVVVSNIHKPNKVIIFGWYRHYLTDKDGRLTSELAPDVFDDGKGLTTVSPAGVVMQTPNRQPLQPKSNVHGDFYFDYSHGIRLVGPVSIVNGQPMETAALYQHPTLSRLVSNEGPVRVPRYPGATVPPAPVRLSNTPVTAQPLGDASETVVMRAPFYVPFTPSPITVALDYIARRMGFRRS